MNEIKRIYSLVVLFCGFYRCCRKKGGGGHLHLLNFKSSQEDNLNGNLCFGLIRIE